MDKLDFHVGRVSLRSFFVDSTRSTSPMSRVYHLTAKKPFILLIFARVKFL